MAKNIKYFCKECGCESVKWLGQCPSCKAWNSLVETPDIDKTKGPVKSRIIAEQNIPLSLDDIHMDTSERYDTNNEELNRVLGGGLVKGSLVLLGGDPGIGKSTLLLQICNSLGEYGTVLYVSGEESSAQIKMRADRININTKNLLILSENDLDKIEDYINEIKPKIIIVDSVQTLYRPSIDTSAGSITQVREITTSLTYISKKTGSSIFLIGHVTKDGTLAGPRVLEHLVDTVLYFEGDRYGSYRILRAVKNRFGSTNEIGVFEMCEEGFKEVNNPSGLFIDENNVNNCGCVITCTIEGTRPVLVELQSLASLSSFGNPRRMTTGLDNNRIVLLIAILEKRAEVDFMKYDVYFNVVGGFKINERCSDLAIAIAMYSSMAEKKIKEHTAIVGEVSLTGDIRSVSNIEKRINECQKMGFENIIIPKINYDKLEIDKFNINIIPVKDINDAILKSTGEN